MSSSDHAASVLVIDGDPFSSRSLALLIRSWGYEVREARCAASALSSAERLMPAVLVVDPGLTVVNGWQATRLIRDGRSVPPRCIAVSACPTEADYRCSRESGFEAHLTKPVHPWELHAVMSGVYGDTLPARVFPANLAPSGGLPFPLVPLPASV